MRPPENPSTSQTFDWGGSLAWRRENVTLAFAEMKSENTAQLGHRSPNQDETWASYLVPGPDLEWKTGFQDEHVLGELKIHEKQDFTSMQVVLRNCKNSARPTESTNKRD